VKFLIDTNVVLDLMLDRTPFADDAAQLFDQAERGNISAVLCGTTVTTIFYIAAKTIGARKAKQAVGGLLSLCEVAPVGRAVLEAGIASDFQDFEDAVLAAAGRIANVDAIVTRNAKDFRKAGLPAYNAAQAVELLLSRERG
jgi:predicted nucleic acid-binding protein